MSSPPLPKPQSDKTPHTPSHRFEFCLRNSLIFEYFFPFIFVCNALKFACFLGYCSLAWKIQVRNIALEKTLTDLAARSRSTEDWKCRAQSQEALPRVICPPFSAGLASQPFRTNEHLSPEKAQGQAKWKWLVNIVRRLEHLAKIYNTHPAVLHKVHSWHLNSEGWLSEGLSLNECCKCYWGEIRHKSLRRNRDLPDKCACWQSVPAKCAKQKLSAIQTEWEMQHMQCMQRTAHRYI